MPRIECIICQDPKSYCFGECLSPVNKFVCCEAFYHPECLKLLILHNRQDGQSHYRCPHCRKKLKISPRLVWTRDMEEEKHYQEVRRTGKIGAMILGFFSFIIVIGLPFLNASFMAGTCRHKLLEKCKYIPNNTSCVEILDDQVDLIYKMSWILSFGISLGIVVFLSILSTYYNMNYSLSNICGRITDQFSDSFPPPSRIWEYVSIKYDLTSYRNKPRIKNFLNHLRAMYQLDLRCGILFSLALVLSSTGLDMAYYYGYIDQTFNTLSELRHATSMYLLIGNLHLYLVIFIIIGIHVYISINDCRWNYRFQNTSTGHIIRGIQLTSFDRSYNTHDDLELGADSTDA